MKIWTIGQIARVTQVAPRTVVNRWCDTGKLKYYRLPGSLDRRVQHDEFVRFLRKYDMKAALLEAVYPAVLLVGFPPGEIKLGVELATARNTFEAGTMFRPGDTRVVVVDWRIGYTEARVIAESCRTADPAPILVAVRHDEWGDLPEGETLGYKHVLPRSLAVSDLTGIIYAALEEDLHGQGKKARLKASGGNLVAHCG